MQKQKLNLDTMWSQQQISQGQSDVQQAIASPAEPYASAPLLSHSTYPHCAS